MRVSELDKIKRYQLEIDNLRTYMLSSMRKAIDVLITSELLRAAARERALLRLRCPIYLPRAKLNSNPYTENLI